MKDMEEKILSGVFYSFDSTYSWFTSSVFS